MMAERSGLSTASILGVLAAGFVAIALAGYGYYAALVRMHDREMEIQLTYASQTLKAVKRHVSNQYALMDQATLAIAEALDGRDPATIAPGELAAIKASVDRPIAPYRIETAIWLPDGTNALLGPTGPNIGDREFFAVHFEPDGPSEFVRDAHTGLVISAPVLGRLRNEQILPVSRALRAADGSVRGVIVASMPVSSMLDVFDLLRRAPNDVLFLMRDDAMGIARFPEDPRFIGRHLPSALVFQNYPRVPEGRFFGEAATDGIRRVGAHLSLAPLPMVAGFSLETAALRLETMQQYGPFVTIGAAQVVVTLVFLTIAIGAMRRANVERDRALARDRELVAVLDGANDAIVMLDENLLVRVFNRAAEKMFGRRADEMMGRKIDALIPDSVRARHEELMRALPQGPASARVMSDWRVVRGLRESGETFPAMVSISKTVTDGAPAFLAILRDMSEVERQEVQLRHSLDSEARLRVEAEQASRAKSLFLASMSHELRTPLNAIIGFSEAMIAGVGGPIVSKEHREYLGHVVSSGRHLLDIINDIIDISRIHTGDQTLDISDVPIRDALRMAETLLNQKMTAQGVRLDASGVDDDATAAADQRALRQILINLVGNSIRFSPRSGTIRVLARREGSTIDVRVVDQGPGIPPRVMEQLGKPFVQDRAQLTSNNEGIGLGLAISIALAERMGGRLRFTNRAEGGLEARLTLPAA